LRSIAIKRKNLVHRHGKGCGHRPFGVEDEGEKVDDVDGEFASRAADGLEGVGCCKGCGFFDSVGAVLDEVGVQERGLGKREGTYYCK